MLRRLAPAALLFLFLAFFLAFAAPAAHAQVNIDQDKSPAHIFASDCTVCHKSTRGLANGRGNSALTGFLAEHYTSSHEEAAAMAAYVLASGGGVGTAAPARDQNATATRDRASTEEPKTRQARRPPKPDQGPAASGKPNRAAGERGKREESATAEPGRPAAEGKPAVERPEANTPPRQHDRQKPAETPAPASAPAAVTAERKPAEPLKPEIAPMGPAASAVAPPQGEPNKSSPAPTDNIPD